MQTWNITDKMINEVMKKNRRGSTMKIILMLLGGGFLLMSGYAAAGVKVTGTGINGSPLTFTDQSKLSYTIINKSQQDLYMNPGTCNAGSPTMKPGETPHGFEFPVPCNIELVVGGNPPTTEQISFDTSGADKASLDVIAKALGPTIEAVTTKNSVTFEPETTATVHPALTTNFTSVGTPYGGCGVPGAAFSENQADTKSAFNQLELNNDGGPAAEEGKDYRNNYIALNVEDTPISNNNTWMAEDPDHNSIVNNYMVKYQSHNRPMGNENSSQGPLESINPGALPSQNQATLVGDWDDGANCGRYLAVNVYAKSPPPPMGQNVGISDQIWDSNLNLTDNAPSIYGGVATINPSEFNNEVPLYHNDFIVHDSCQDVKTVCRGFTDVSPKHPEMKGIPSAEELPYTKDHIDLHSFGKMYDGLGNLQSMADLVPDEKGAPHAKRVDNIGNGNLYVKWHYLDKNPTWIDGTSKPKLGLVNNSTLQIPTTKGAVRVAFTHLENGIHGVLYCVGYNSTTHTCPPNEQTSTATWFAASMDDDHGEVYRLDNIWATDINKTIAVRIIDADGKESNDGNPYTFKLPTTTPVTGAIYQQGGSLTKADADCSGLSTGGSCISVVGSNDNNPAYVPITPIGEDLQFATKNLKFKLALQSLSDKFTKFEQAEIIPSGTDLGYHGSCTTDGDCSFWVPDTVKGPFKLSLTGDIDVSAKPSVRSEKQKLSATNIPNANANGVPVTLDSTLYTSYIPITFNFSYASGSGSYHLHPEDTDQLNIDVKDSNDIPGKLFKNVADDFHLAAPTLLTVPMDNSNSKPLDLMKGERVMYEVKGSDPNKSETLTFTVRGQVPVDTTTENIEATDVILHARSFEALQGDGNMAHGASDTFRLDGPNPMTVTFNGGNPILATGLIYNYAEINPLSPQKYDFAVKYLDAGVAGKASADKCGLPKSIQLNTSDITTTKPITVPTDQSATLPSSFFGGVKITMPAAAEGNQQCNVQYWSTLSNPTPVESKTGHIIIQYSLKSKCDYTAISNKEKGDPKVTLTINDRAEPTWPQGTTPPEVTVQFKGTDIPHVYPNGMDNMRIHPGDVPGTGIPYPEPPPKERRGPRTITETGNLQGQADPTKQGDEIPKPITFGLQSDYHSPEDPPVANPQVGSVQLTTPDETVICHAPPKMPNKPF